MRDPILAALHAWRAAGPGRTIHLSSRVRDGARLWVAAADRRNDTELRSTMAFAGPDDDGPASALTRLAYHLEVP